MNERQNKIIDLLSKEKKVEVTKLSKVFAVSQVTIRKDLDSLESKGLIIREHGYATINDSDDINNRLIFNYSIKQKIAYKASELVNNGETIMIESGSSLALLALELANKKDITIITNSAFIASFIRNKANTKVILLGGEYQNESQVNIGPMIKKCCKDFHVDKFFIGVDGFNKDIGFTGNDYMRVQAVQDMSGSANKIIVVTDSSKFNRTSLVSLMPINKIDTVITDNLIDNNIKEYLINNNINLIETVI